MQGLSFKIKFNATLRDDIRGRLHLQLKCEVSKALDPGDPLITSPSEPSAHLRREETHKHTFKSAVRFASSEWRQSERMKTRLALRRVRSFIKELSERECQFRHFVWELGNLCWPAAAQIKPGRDSVCLVAEEKQEERKSCSVQWEECGLQGGCINILNPAC